MGITKSKFGQGRGQMPPLGFDLCPTSDILIHTDSACIYLPPLPIVIPGFHPVEGAGEEASPPKSPASPRKKANCCGFFSIGHNTNVSLLLSSPKNFSACSFPPTKFSGWNPDYHLICPSPVGQKAERNPGLDTLHHMVYLEIVVYFFIVVCAISTQGGSHQFWSGLLDWWCACAQIFFEMLYQKTNCNKDLENKFLASYCVK